MYYSLWALVGILASTGSALPNQKSPRNQQPSCKTFTDNFENIAGAATGRAVVGTYDGVTYQGFNAAAKSPVTGSTGGVIPHSGSQDIVVGVGNDATQLGSVTLNPFGNIIASPSKAFNLYSFWFGCGTNLEQPAASMSTACVLSVIGFNIAGQKLPVLTYSYSPTSPTAAPMVLAALPAYYKGLKNVTMGLAASTSTPATTAIWVDDVTHCNYS